MSVSGEPSATMVTDPDLFWGARCSFRPCFTLNQHNANLAAIRDDVTSVADMHRDSFSSDEGQLRSLRP